MKTTCILCERPCSQLPPTGFDGQVFDCSSCGSYSVTATMLAHPPKDKVIRDVLLDGLADQSELDSTMLKAAIVSTIKDSLDRGLGDNETLVQHSRLVTLLKDGGIRNETRRAIEVAINENLIEPFDSTSFRVLL